MSFAMFALGSAVVLGLAYAGKPKSSRSSSGGGAFGPRTVAAAGAVEPESWSWRVLEVPGGYLGQWRAPHSAGFAPTWIDVPHGVTKIEAGNSAQAIERARNLALEQIGYAQMGVEVVDSGTENAPAGSFRWQVVRTAQGLFEGQVELIAGTWTRVEPQATSPYYAKLLALEAIGQLPPE
jgi:hypothetical protein